MVRGEGKKTNFELGVRVPLLIRAPHIPGSAGTRSAELAELVDIYHQLQAEKAKKELAGQGSKGPLPDHLLGIWAPDVEASMKLLMKSPNGLEGKAEFGEQFLLLMRNYYATMRVTKTRTHLTTFYNMGGKKATVRAPYHVLSKEGDTYKVSFKCNYYSSQLKRNVRGDSISLLKVLPDGRVSSAFAFGQFTAEVGQEMPYNIIFKKIK